MSYEDFTTYTEHDIAANRITVAANKITTTGLLYNEDCYVHKDYGVNHFGDFEHLLTIDITASEESSTAGNLLAFEMLSNTASCGYQQPDNTYTKINQYRSSNNPYPLALYIGGNGVSDAYTPALNTIYYLTFKRSGTTGTLKIYSDSSRTTLLDTLTITTSATEYRYLVATAGQNYTSSGTNAVSGYTENLDLQESPAPSGSDFIPNYFESSFVN